MRQAASHIPTFAKTKARIEEPKEERGTVCYAHGCAQYGSISEGFGADARFLCWIHYDATDPMDWPRLTRATEENEDLVYFVNELAKKTTFDLEFESAEHKPEGVMIDKWLRQHGYDEMCRIIDDKGKKEALPHWIMRCRAHALWILNGRKKRSFRK